MGEPRLEAKCLCYWADLLTLVSSSQLLNKMFSDPEILAFRGVCLLRGPGRESPVTLCRALKLLCVLSGPGVSWHFCIHVLRPDFGGLPGFSCSFTVFCILGSDFYTSSFSSSFQKFRVFLWNSITDFLKSQQHMHVVSLKIVTKGTKGLFQKCCNCTKPFWNSCSKLTCQSCPFSE